LKKHGSLNTTVAVALFVLRIEPMGNGSKKVLIVEDNADWREVLMIIVRRLGHEVLVARTAEEGVAQARRALPDLILMDIGLPRMSGDQATAQLKAEPATKDIPVVVQTAFGTGASAKRALEAGAAEILHKPITITDIQKTLAKYLSDGDRLSKPGHAGS
jgi:two-component system cell cycle response regulator DivK